MEFALTSSRKTDRDRMVSGFAASHLANGMKSDGEGNSRDGGSSPSYQPLATMTLSGYVTMFAQHKQIHNTIRPKDFILAHAFASLTTSSVFEETSVSILTPAPDSLDKFLQYTDTGSFGNGKI